MISESIIFPLFGVAKNLIKKQSIIQSEPGPLTKILGKNLLDLTKTIGSGFSLKSNQLLRESPCFNTPKVKF